MKKKNRRSTEIDYYIRISVYGLCTNCVFFYVFFGSQGEI